MTAGRGVVRAAWLALALVAPGLGCSKPVTEADCDKLVAHLTDLLAEGEDKEKVEKVKGAVKADKATGVTVREICVGKLSRDQYDCMLKAESFKAAAACDNK